MGETEGTKILVFWQKYYQIFGKFYFTYLNQWALILAFYLCFNLFFRISGFLPSNKRVGLEIRRKISLTVRKQPVLRAAEEKFIQYKANMLGIESEISVEGEVTSLSIMSQPNTNDKGKNLSTNKASTLDGEECSGSHREGTIRAQKVRGLRAKLLEIEKQQNLFEHKMKNCVGIIQKEVKKKEEKNKELSELIKTLKEQLLESRADIEVLSNYIIKQKPSYAQATGHRKQSPYSTDRTILDSSNNTNNTKGQKNIKVSSKDIGIKSSSPKIHRQLKSSSPSNPGISSQSPKGRNQVGKKSSSPGVFVSSPFTRKIKGPIK